MEIFCDRHTDDKGNRDPGFIEKKLRLLRLRTRKYDCVVDTADQDLELRNAQFVSSGGVRVSIGTLEQPFELPNSTPHIDLPTGTRVARIDFSPFYVNDFRPELRSISLALLTRDYPVYFQKAAKLDRPPKYLFGVTNEHMAQFAEAQMGLQVVERFTVVEDEEEKVRYQVAGTFNNAESAAKRLATRRHKGELIRDVLMRRAAEHIVQIKGRVPTYKRDVDLDFDIHQLIADREDTFEDESDEDEEESGRIPTAVVGYSALVGAFGSMAVLDYANGKGMAAHVDTFMAALFAALAWRKRK